MAWKHQEDEDTAREKYEHEECERAFSELINRLSLENYSDTPDFILAAFLTQCLNAFDSATNDRTAWYLVKQGKDRMT